MELQGPTRVQEVLAYWDEVGDIPAVTPPSSPRSDGGTSSREASDVGDDETDAAAVGGEGFTWGPRLWEGIFFKLTTMGEYGCSPHVYRGGGSKHGR